LCSLYPTPPNNKASPVASLSTIDVSITDSLRLHQCVWISSLPLPLSWLTHPPLPPYPYQPPVNRVETNNQLINGQSIYNTNLNNNKIAIRTMSLQPAVPTPIPHTHDSNVLPPTSFPNKQPQTVPPSPGSTRRNRAPRYQESFSSDGT